MFLICHACGHTVAKIVEIKLPIFGAMFVSKDEKHGFPAPWSPVITWEWMYCPMCQKRAFVEPDKETGHITIVTDEGHFTREDLDLLSDDDTPDDDLSNEPSSSSAADNGDPVDHGDAFVVGGTSTGGSFDSSPEEDTEDNTGLPDDDTKVPVTVSSLIKSGKVIRRGSWYDYDGETYRKTDLVKLINSNG